MTKDQSAPIAGHELQIVSADKAVCSCGKWEYLYTSDWTDEEGIPSNEQKRDRLTWQFKQHTEQAHEIKVLDAFKDKVKDIIHFFDGWTYEEREYGEATDRWTYTSQRHYEYAKHKTGAKLCFRYQNHDARMAISGMFNHEHVQNCRLEITVSPSRDAKAIAADVTRRLIPNYLVKWAENEEAREKHEEAIEQKESTLNHFASLMDTNPWQDKVTKYVDDGPTIEVQTYHGSDQVKIEARSVPFDLARKIVKLLLNGK